MIHINRKTPGTDDDGVVVNTFGTPDQIAFEYGLAMFILAKNKDIRKPLNQAIALYATMYGKEILKDVGIDMGLAAKQRRS